MRVPFVLLPLSLCTAPAVAQPAPPPQPKPLQLPPDTAARINDAMQSLSNAVRDLAEDPQTQQHVQQQIAAARPRIEQSIKAVNEALPKVAADLQHAHQAIQRAIENMPDPYYPRR